MRWFADRKDFATGLAVGGFDLGALLASFLGEWLLQRFSCAMTAVTAVAIMGLFNGLGRLGWSSLSDRLERTRTWMIMFLVQGLLFFVLRNGVSPLVLAVGLWFIASCYGGGFAICPTQVAETFGPARAPRIYGLTLTIWSSAALISHPLAVWLRESSSSYAFILSGCCPASGIGLGLVTALRPLLRASQACEAQEASAG